MEFMMLISACLDWIIFDGQLPLECDTESTVHTEVLACTDLAKAVTLLVSRQLLHQPCSVEPSSAPKG